MRILIVQTAFLGDVVLTLPMVGALQQRFPGARVDLLTVPAHAPVVLGQPGVAAVVTYDKRGAQRGIRGLLRIIRRVRVRKYDLVLSPHRSLRSAVLVACSRSPRRIGFDQPLTRWAYTDTVSRLTQAHEVERNLRLLAALGADVGSTPSRLSLRVMPEMRRQAAAYFTAYGVDPEAVVIGIIPGSQWGTKRWPAERFAALIEHLCSWTKSSVQNPPEETVQNNTSGYLSSRTQIIQQNSPHIALFGGPQDRAIADAIVGGCRVPVLDLVGRTPLQALPAYLAHCAVVVSNDTGPMHIAAALGKPILALFGPTTPELGFAPYGVPWEEVSVALACRPCHAHGPHRCPLAHWRCMMDISVARVAAGVERLLAQTVGSRREEGDWKGQI